jgi:hypothetical protein
MSSSAMVAGSQRRASDRKYNDTKITKLRHGGVSLQAYPERKGTMKTSTNQAGNLGPTISKIVMALAVASVMGGMAITPALGDNYDRQGHRDNGRHNGQWRGDRDRRDYRPEHQHPYYYSQPVYAPPPVYYAPQPSPGISFFFPLDIRR